MYALASSRPMAAISHACSQVAADRAGRRRAAPTSVALNLTKGMMWASGALKRRSVMCWLTVLSTTPDSR